MKNREYDIIIVGCGVSACFLAYELISNNNKIDILIIEKGDKLNNRKCLKNDLALQVCQNCKCCNILFGFSGLGKSEGKYNYTTQFGGFLKDIVNKDKTKILFERVDSILTYFKKMDRELYNTYNEELSIKAKNCGAKALFSKTHHLGTSISFDVYNNIYDFLKDKVSIIFNTEVKYVEKKANFSIHTEDNIYFSKKVVFATGTNSQSVKNLLVNTLSIDSSLYRVDVGLRVETDVKTFENILKTIGEFKIENNNTYTYCMNPYGYVVEKDLNSHLCADGQNYLECGTKSPNINFSIFYPFIFNSEAELSSFLNNLRESCENSIVVQRLVDLKNNKITSSKILKLNSIKPSLNAFNGNINDIFDKDFVNGILLMIEKIEKIFDIKINEETILYSYDLKKYSNKIQIDKTFQTPISDLYVIGDCSGYTNSLAQAAASGIYLAPSLLK